ncbi:MAG: T9SS type A sorting domain-containing protein [Ignavibacteriaceae bacterium]|nr:T9SS type A sorting domain-containing protein [Ignavibacteriaceae bacterium]
MKTLFTVDLIIVLLISACSIFSQEYQDWKFTHPTPQANGLREIKMIDVNTWVTTGENGTFMKTLNGGVNWFFHHQAGRYSDAAQTIGQNYNLWFFNSMIGYVTGVRGYIGKTTNGGNTFDSVGVGVIPNNEWGQGMWFANQDTGFVTTRQSSWTNGRIVRTTNGGSTWTTVQTYSQGITSVWGTNSQTVYAVAVDGTIFKTTNAGQSWTQSIGVVPQYMYDMSFLNQNTGFVAGSEGGIARTTNAGLTWIPLISPQVDWAFFQIKIVSATEIYAVGDPGVLYKSTDLGNTWQSLPISVSGPASTFIWYSMDKIGSTIVICGDYGIVAKSTDNGLTWSSNNFLLNTNILFDVALAPNTNNLFAVGRQYSTGTRQVFYSTNYGTNWTTKDLGIDMNASSICMVNSQIGYISGTNCQVLKTTDGGVSWFPVTQPTAGTFDIYKIDFVTPDLGWVFINYVAISGGNIFKTTNGGTTWTQQGSNISYSIYSADMVDANVGYVTINSSGQPIYKTTDGGANWFSVATPLTGIVKTVKAINANTIYIGASFGATRMAKSTNGGTNWTPVALPVSFDVSNIDFMDADTGYVCGNTTTVVCRTTNGGLNWSFQNVHLPTLAGVKVLANDIAFALGTYGSILRYDPHGYVPVELTSFTSSVSGNKVLLKWITATELNNQGFDVERASLSASPYQGWEKIGFVAGSGTTTEPRSYSYIDNDLNPGKYFYRLRQIDYNGTFEFSDEIEVEIYVPFDFALEQNYPNPFNPSTKIKYSVPADAFVNIAVYNIVGEKIMDLVDSIQKTGSYEVTFDASALSSGMYFYRMESGSFEAVKKMMILK